MESEGVKSLDRILKVVKDMVKGAEESMKNE